jgi:hypothetical protein
MTVLLAKIEPLLSLKSVAGILSRIIGAVWLLMAVPPLLPATEWTLPCNAPVQSAKRGLAAEGDQGNSQPLVQADFAALSPGISWWYDWGYSPSPGQVDTNGFMQYLPMDWGGGTQDINGVLDWLENNHPAAVLAINEPSLSGQADLTPAQTATDIQNLQSAAGDFTVVAPQMALGTPYDGGTWQQYLTEVFDHLGTNTPAATGLHCYADFATLTNAFTTMTNITGGLPVWITEFSDRNASSLTNQMAYMIQAVDWMERTPGVAHYAWYKDRNSKDNPYSDILSATNGLLTALGNVYVNLPIHDPTLYYTIPGQLQAARYAAMNAVALQPTTDTNGLFEVGQIASGSWLDYNLDVPTNGIYTLSVRVGGVSPAQFQILSGSAVLARVNAPFSGHATLTVGKLSMPAGHQTLRLQATGPGSLLLGWLQWLTPFEQWAQSWGLPADGTGNGAPNASPAGDGIPNLLKYALNISPLVPGYQGHLTSGPTSLQGTNYISIIYTSSDPPPVDLGYLVEVTDDLDSGAWTNQTSRFLSVPLANGTVTVTNCDLWPVGAFNRRFMRFGVTAEP